MIVNDSDEKLIGKLVLAVVPDGGGKPIASAGTVFDIPALGTFNINQRHC
jgi:hypothetical protein